MKIHTNFSVGKREEKRPFGRRKHTCEDNVKMGLEEIGCGLDSSCSGKGPVAGSFEHGNELSGSIKPAELID
jgi:hypothetical protein